MSLRLLRNRRVASSSHHMISRHCLGKLCISEATHDDETSRPQQEDGVLRLQGSASRVA